MGCLANGPIALLQGFKVRHVNSTPRASTRRARPGLSGEGHQTGSASLCCLMSRDRSEEFEVYRSKRREQEAEGEEGEERRWETRGAANSRRRPSTQEGWEKHARCRTCIWPTPPRPQMD
ncbi:unnamed protein product [Prorocentrum cordatum]|uniref:Uncharacterized protein n=1 Tax=Prorocentrum cordatum TaxID=2364126 RepID=A0ABN9SJ55_9DINO|nr:unnamed protein product [Polarella glacialis]